MFRASDMAPAPQSISCDECLEDLPAYIDLKDTDAAEAAQTYPGVWWHLWICPDCSETYSLTRMLLDSHKPQNWVLHQPGARQPLEWLHPICIPRSDLRGLLPNPYNLRLTTRGADRRQAIFDGAIDAEETHQCTVWATKMDDASYQIDVESFAPLDCTVEFRCGDVQLHATFDAEGWARLGAVPVALLTDENGPDLNLTFVATAATN